MAFPVVEATDTGSTPAGATTHTVSIPSGNAGDLILIIVGVIIDSSGVTYTPPAGFTQLIAPTSFGDFVCGFGKIADGSEGATVSFDTSASTIACWHVYRVSGTDALPELGGDSIAPAGGAADYLFIACLDGFGTTPAISAAPAGYSDLLTATAGSEVLGSATRSANASSETPGAFTFSGFAATVPFVLAVAPGGAAPPATTKPYVQAYVIS